MRKTVLSISIFVFCWIWFILSPSWASAQSYPEVNTSPTYSGRATDNRNYNPKPDGWTPVNQDHNLYEEGWNPGYDPGPKPYLGNIVNTPNSGPVCNPYLVNAQIRGPKSFPVTLCGFSASPGQPVHAPQTCQGPWMVVYADEGFITLQANTSDCMEGAPCPAGTGYGVHIDGLRVNPALLAQYRADNPNGLRSGHLPTVKPNEVIGTADGNEVRVTVRDSGDFMDPRAKRDWWEEMDWSNCTRVLSTRYGVIGISKKRSPDDYENICQRINYATGPQNSEMSIYTNKNGNSQPEMRTNANFDLSSMSRGVHCGDTKSEPLVLTETSSFDINEGLPDGICKDTWWSGEIQFNYNNETNNFRLPFAQELADHWAGTLDAEHMQEEDINKLFALAYPVYDINDTSADIRRKSSDSATASAEIKRRQGVLKALLPAETQDKLKCSFVRFVQKKLGSNGGTLYKDFAIEGTKLADIPCPPTVDNLKASLSEYEDWYRIWGSKWSKMALFPNERSIGDLRFDICGSKTHYLSLLYPEMFRLGLAANELFKIFTDKAGIDRYYLGYNDLQNMKLPVDQNPILTANLGASLPVESTLAQTAPATNTVPTASAPKTSSPSVLQRLVSFLKSALPVVKNALAQTIEKYNPLRGNNNGKLLAQGCVALEPHVEVVSENPFNYALVVTRTSCAPPGILGDIEIYSNNNNGYHAESMPGNELRYLQTYPGADSFMPKVNSTEELSKLSWNLVGKRLPEGYKIAGIGFSYNGPVSPGTPGAPGGPGGPSENKCDTPTCSDTCSLCPKAQLFPSDNTLWPQSYPKGHMLIGTEWTGSGYSEGPEDAVHYNYAIPAWDGTYEGIEKVPGCQYKECREDDENCARDYCFTDHGCGHIDCTSVHKRVIDITNELPFAASIWRQGFEVDNGIEKFCYNQCIKGGGKTDDCKSFCKIPSGFFNIFKPKCDPSDPACPGYKAGKTDSFVGCTTDEKYVFDNQGDFGDNPGASYLTYTFSPTFGYEARQFSKDVTVTQKSPGVNENALVLFYKMGGMCNTNKWVTEKALNPASIGGTPESTGNLIITPLSGPCKGKVLDANKYYNKDTCKETVEAACCKNLISIYENDARSKSTDEDTRKQAAKDAVWTCDERDNCYPESCPPYSTERDNGWCGKFVILYGDKKGSEFAK